MSNDDCIFCDTILLKKLDGQQYDGYLYGCENCGSYAIDNLDKHYFESLSVEERQWYKSKLNKTKDSRPYGFFIGEWIPCSPRSWVRIEKKGHLPVVLVLLCNEKGKYTWTPTTYDAKLHGN